ncbi:cystathionine beta-synthase, partial [Shewanella sp. WXL01]|nr:cystathionine beta-synthase [Shewanella sp. WXL01]
MVKSLAVTALLGLGLVSSAHATPWKNLDAEQLEATLVKKFSEGKYSSKGADSCLMCHKKNDTVTAIFDGVHGQINNS